MMRQKNYGFTLLEVIMVVVIVSIIVAIALPSYQSSVRKSRRADAMAALMQVAALQEQWYNRNNSYSPNADPFGGNASYTSEKGYYTVTANTDADDVSDTDGSGCATDAQCLLLEAEPVDGNAQDGDECGTFQLTGTGFKGFTGSKGSKDLCW